MDSALGLFEVGSDVLGNWHRAVLLLPLRERQHKKKRCKNSLVMGHCIIKFIL